MGKQTTIKNKKIHDGHHTPGVTFLTDEKGNTIHFEAQFPYEVRENSSGSWIAYSPHFKTFGYSRKDEKSAIEDLRIAIDTFFKVHRQAGTLENALLRFGWYKERNVILKPRLFNTPIPKGAHRRNLNLVVQGDRVCAEA